MMITRKNKQKCADDNQAHDGWHMRRYSIRKGKVEYCAYHGSEKVWTVRGAADDRQIEHDMQAFIDGKVRYEKMSNWFLYRMPAG